MDGEMEGERRERHPEEKKLVLAHKEFSHEYVQESHSEYKEGHQIRSEVRLYGIQGSKRMDGELWFSCSREWGRAREGECAQRLEHV